MATSSLYNSSLLSPPLTRNNELQTAAYQRRNSSSLSVQKLGTLRSHPKFSCFHLPLKSQNGENVSLKITSAESQIAPPSDDENLPSFFTNLAKLLIVPSIAMTCMFSSIEPAEARLSGVNRPELLPKGEITKVIDVAGFLSPGQESRISQKLNEIENDTGFKLRVLAQNYPETPGLAIKDYWGVDDDTIVFVADPSLGNILNFNVGAAVDLSVPRSFWSRVAGKYGNVFYWKENGEDASIEAAVEAIDICLKEPQGPRKCSEVK